MARYPRPALGPLADIGRNGRGVVIAFAPYRPPVISIDFPPDPVLTTALTHQPWEVGEDCFEQKCEPTGALLWWPATPAGRLLADACWAFGVRYLCSDQSLTHEPDMWWTDDGSYRR